MDDKIPECVICKCKGNNSCGHRSADEKMECALDRAGVCPCCKNKKQK